jgi:hypothetical protein
VKQSEDKSCEDKDERNDEIAEVDKAGDNEVDECAWV